MGRTWGRNRVAAGLALAWIAAASAPAADLESFAWLAGTWKRESSRGTVYETWRAVSERTLEGESYVVSRSTGEKRLTESLLLVEMGGEIFYVPRPTENPLPVAFRLTSSEAGRAVFENPSHDFPTKIVYERNADGSMTASVEGPAGGGEEPERIDFRFTRAD